MRPIVLLNFIFWKSRGFISAGWNTQSGVGNEWIGTRCDPTKILSIRLTLTTENWDLEHFWTGFIDFSASRGQSFVAKQEGSGEGAGSGGGGVGRITVNPKLCYPGEALAPTHRRWWLGAVCFLSMKNCWKTCFFSNFRYFPRFFLALFFSNFQPRSIFQHFFSAIFAAKITKNRFQQFSPRSGGFYFQHFFSAIFAAKRRFFWVIFSNFRQN